MWYTTNKHWLFLLHMCLVILVQTLRFKRSTYYLVNIILLGMDHYLNVPVPKTVLNNKFLFANLDGKVGYSLTLTLHSHNLDSLVFSTTS